MAEIDVRALASLARMEVSDEEVSKLEKEIPSILTFVESIQNVKTSHERKEADVWNVMREDAHPHESGVYTEALLKAAPARVDDRVAVKQVISRKSAQGGLTSGRK